MRRLNFLKIKKRTGQDVPSSGFSVRQQIFGGPISVSGGHQPSSRRHSGGLPSKRAGRRRQSPEVQIVGDDEDLADGSGSDSDGEAEVSDYETPEGSDVEKAVDALTSPGQDYARRTSGRRRSVIKSLKEDSSGSSEETSDSDGKNIRRGKNFCLASESLHSLPGGAPKGQQSTAKSAAGGSSKQQRRRSIKVVQDDTVTSGPNIQLPMFTPVPVHWPSSIDDALCSVCGDGEDADGNQVLLCDGGGCTVAVHQQCYGVPKLPKGKWLCDGCKAKLSPSEPSCACCPVVGGAVRKVVSFGRAVPQHKGGNSYVHVACALWTPEITLADPESMRGVQLGHMTRVRAELECALCKQAGGAVVQCDFANCCRPFHVMCGRASGNLLTFRETDGYPLAFCGLHSTDRFERNRNATIEGKVAIQGAEEEGGADMEEDGLPDADQPGTEYDLQRLKNIERNKQVLADLRGQVQQK